MAYNLEQLGQLRSQESQQQGAAEEASVLNSKTPNSTLMPFENKKREQRQAAGKMLIRMMMGVPPTSGGEGITGVGDFKAGSLGDSAPNEPIPQSLPDPIQTGATESTGGSSFGNGALGTMVNMFQGGAAGENSAIGSLYNAMQGEQINGNSAISSLYNNSSDDKNKTMAYLMEQRDVMKRLGM